MFHYGTGKINTTPLSSAAITHFFIISYIFHFCRAASALSREKDSNIQKSASLLFCCEAKDRPLDGNLQKRRRPPRQGNQGTRQHGAVSPSASLEQLHQRPGNTAPLPKRGSHFKGNRGRMFESRLRQLLNPWEPRPPFWQEQKSFQGSTARCNQTQAQTLILRASVLQEGEFGIDFCDQMFSGCSEHTSNPPSPFYLPLSQAF